MPIVKHDFSATNVALWNSAKLTGELRDPSSSVRQVRLYIPAVFSRVLWGGQHVKPEPKKSCMSLPTNL